MTAPPDMDARLRMLDRAAPETREPVATTAWGRAMAETITATPPHPVRARSRRWVGIAAATATAAAIAALMVALIVSTGHGDRTPVAGRQVVLVAAPVPGGPAISEASLRSAASVLVVRAAALGVDGLTATPRGGALVVDLPKGSPADLVASITIPGRLTMVPDRPVARRASSLSAAVRQAQAAAGVPVTGGGQEAVPAGYIVASVDVLKLRPRRVRSEWVALRRVPAVTEASVASAQARPARGLPTVSVRFTRRGEAEFAALTRRLAEDGQLRGRLQGLAIILDGREITNPVIDYNENPNGIRSTGAEIPIPDDLRATTIAAALDSGPLPVTLTPAP